MRAVLVHHADAESPAVDPQRPLTRLGLAQAATVAEALQRAGFVPAAIWHSGKLRARQTAEVFLRRGGPFAEFRMVRGLRPDDPPDWIRHELQAETRDILLVGHMPNISALAEALAPGCGGVPAHGFAIFDRDPAGVWREIDRGAPAE
jgi:phosphohistidine phosphatase